MNFPFSLVREVFLNPTVWVLDSFTVKKFDFKRQVSQHLLLLNENRFKATLVQLRKVKPIKKLVKVKILINEQDSNGLMEKFIALFKSAQ